VVSVDDKYFQISSVVPIASKRFLSSMATNKRSGQTKERGGICQRKEKYHRSYFWLRGVLVLLITCNVVFMAIWTRRTIDGNIDHEERRVDGGGGLGGGGLVAPQEQQLPLTSPFRGWSKVEEMVVQV
jgi:hypothetical protein